MTSRWLLAAFVAVPLALTSCSKREFNPDPPTNGQNGQTNNGMTTNNDGMPEQGKIGDSCDADPECNPGLVCEMESGTCQAPGDVAEGSACFRTAECADDLYCDAVTSVCTPAGDSDLGEPCGDAGDCQAGLACAPSGFSGQCIEPGDNDLGEECEDYFDCIAGLGCGPDLTDPDGANVCQAGLAGLVQPWTGVECAEEETGDFRSYFEVPDGDVTEFYRLPYPNDIRLTNGHPNLQGHPTPGPGVLGFDLAQTYIDTIEQAQDRFGLNSWVYMRFSESVDFDTLDSGGDDATLYTTVLTEDHPAYGDRTSMRWQASTGRGSYICHNSLAVRPGGDWGRPLDPNTTYAVILTTGAKSSGGVPATQDEDFAEMFAATKPGGALGDAWEAYAPLREWVSAEGIDPLTIANAAVFTTGDPIAEAQALRDPARAQTPTASELTVCDEGVTSPCDDGLQGEEHLRGCMSTGENYQEIHGKLSLPIFQEGEAPYLTDGGGVTPDVKRREDVCMAMTVPNGPMPTDGWPVLVYAHGTGGTYRSHVANGTVDIVNSINIDGQTVQFLTIGWDQVQHFTRRNGSELHANDLVFNYQNPASAKGNFLQAAADIHAVMAYVEQLNLDAASSPTGEALAVDPTRIYFMGHSQGGTSGPLALPFDTTSTGAILSGAGAGLTLALLGKTTPVNSPAAVRLALMEEDEVKQTHPVINFLQAYFDPVDPVNFGHLAAAQVIEGETHPKHIFHTSGVGDTYSPNPGLNAMARSLRATYISPVSVEMKGVPVTDAPFSGNVTHDMEVYSVLGRQYEPDGTYDGHFVTFRNATATQDLSEFLGTGVVLGLPEVR